MACNDRQLSQAQREAGFDQQRTGVPLAVRPFSGSATIENLIDYLNRELVPGVRATRSAVNDVFLQVADNAPSANPLSYYFSTDTAASDPTVGRVKLNAATQNTASIIRVSESNARLQSVIPWLDVMSGGPTTPLGTVTLIDAINPGRFLRFDLNTMTDQGSYWDLGVTFIEGSHTDPFVEDEAVVLGFISGVSAAGSTVPVGSLSPIARDTFVGNIGTTTAEPVDVPLADVDSTSLIYDPTSHTFQRAALTGFATASQDSNATSSAEPIVTYSASANMSAERVLTSGDSITIDTGTAGQIKPNYTGSTSNVNLTALTGDQDVIDISTLTCGGSVTVETVTADYTVDGFTAKTDGFWFWFIDRRTSGTAAGRFLEESGATTTSIRNPEETPTIIPIAGRALLYYASNRWRVASPGVTYGLTQSEGTGGAVSLDAGTKVLAVTANISVSGFARSGGNFDGDRFWVRCNDGIECTLEHATGTAANQVSLPYAEDMIIPGRGMMEFRYESSAWRAISTGDKGRLLRITTYTSGSGTHTYLSDCRRARVRGKGGGGGGGGAGTADGNIGGGGGEGGYFELDITDVPTSSAYEVGAGGTAGAADPDPGTAGGAGGDTDFNDGSVTRTGAGGDGGQVGGALAEPGGGGAAPSLGGTVVWACRGAPGQHGYMDSSGTPGYGGNGGGSGGGKGGFGGTGATTSEAGQDASANSGAGGGGGGRPNSPDVAGGAGAAGFIIVEEYT